MAHKRVYDDEVRAPLRLLCEELTAAYGPFHLFRPNRDVRFSKDKSPYKTAAAAVTEGEGGESYYVQLSAEGLMAGTGYYQLAGDQLERYRAAVDDPRSGAALHKAVTAVVRKGYDVGGAQLRTAPRGYPRDHPRIHLLRHKGLYVGRNFTPAAWLSTRACVKRITTAWAAGGDVNKWFNRHVGPSTEPPDEARR
jgi:uncharacterized protein (TIGR02453 family)